MACDFLNIVCVIITFRKTDELVFYQIASVLDGYSEERNPAAKSKTSICPDHLHHQSGPADAKTWCVNLKTCTTVVPDQSDFTQCLLKDICLGHVSTFQTEKELHQEGSKVDVEFLKIFL